MKPRQRTVHFYDVTIKSHTRKQVSNPNCCAISDILSKIKPKGREIIRTANISLEVSDWRVDKKLGLYYCLLNRADASLSDVMLKNLSTKSRRAAGKTKADGIEYSSHIIFKPQADPRKALMMMTMGAGITFQAVEKFLLEFCRELKTLGSNNHLFEFPMPGEYLDTDGSPVTYSVNYSFNATGHMSSRLEDVLRTGSFQEMELSADKLSKFDTGGNLLVDRASIHVVASNTKTISAAVVKNAITRHGTAYRRAQIKYKDKDGTLKQNTFDVNDLDAAFTRKENVELDSEVEGQQTTLNETILKAMRKLI